MPKRNKHEQIRRKKLASAAVTVAAVILLTLFSYCFPFQSLLPAYSFPSLREGELRIHFLDVGQGDCSIIEFPGGNALVIDAGDGAFAHENRLIRTLKGINCGSVSMLLTHADSDHYGGFARLVELFGADVFYLPALSADVARYEALLSAVEAAETETRTLTRYGTIEDESGAYLVCLSPYSSGETDENESSTVLYLQYDGVSAVFTGDVTSAREEKLADEYAIDSALFDSGEYTVDLPSVDILKVAHHGSAYSSAEAWVSLLSPAVSVISCGQGNSYSHPSAEALARLSQTEIYRTDELGDVVVSVYRGGYTVYTDFTGVTEG